jgi:hypothetical protein
MANGTIYPCRFVSIDTAGTADANYNASGNFKVIEDIIAAQAIYGVSQEASDWPPITDSHITNNGYAAIAGEQVKVYGGEERCLIELAATTTAGQMLKANATTDGKGTPVDVSGSVTYPQYFGGFAEQDGYTGDKIRMIVRPGIYTYHA